MSTHKSNEPSSEQNKLTASTKDKRKGKPTSQASSPTRSRHTGPLLSPHASAEILRKLHRTPNFFLSPAKISAGQPKISPRPAKKCKLGPLLLYDHENPPPQIDSRIHKVFLLSD